MSAVISLGHGRIGYRYIPGLLSHLSKVQIVASLGDEDGNGTGYHQNMDFQRGSYFSGRSTILFALWDECLPGTWNAGPMQWIR